VGYLHINNLYKCPDFITNFEEVYAMEKIHGTSAHIKYQLTKPDDQKLHHLSFFSGGEKYENFVTLFNSEELLKRFEALGQNEVVVYGEAYGAKQQGMRATYGDELKFIAFDVKVNGTWLNVPYAHTLVEKYLKLEFVWYKRIPCTMEAIDTERDADSVQAIRNGMGPGHMREGVVLRPISECVDERGERIITKHKRDEFRETKSVRPVSPERNEQLKIASKIANEWVTPMRLQHVIDRAQAVVNNLQGLEKKELGIEDIPGIIDLMKEDVYREAGTEVVQSGPIDKAISRVTAIGFKKWLAERFKEKVQ